VYTVFNIGMMKEISKGSVKHQHHDCCEIVYYTEGSGRLKIGEETFFFKEGDVTYIPPGVYHSEISKNGFKNIFCLLHPIEKFGADFFSAHDNYDQEFKQILLLILRNFLIRANNWEIIVSALTSVLVEYITACMPVNNKSNYVDMCERIIIANISNYDFSTDMLLDDIPLSKSHLVRLFKKETGHTPKAFLYGVRMKYATDLLIGFSSKLRIHDISVMCGYRDQLHFSRAFKQKYGLSPVQWKNAMTGMDLQNNPGTTALFKRY